jgi:hypothetical protein
VVKATTVWLILTTVVSRDWKINQLDVHNTLLNEIFQEEVYIEQPPSFTHHTLASHMCHLHKSLYDLKQVLWDWYNQLSDYMLSIGFCVFEVDASLFILFMVGDNVYLFVYVLIYPIHLAYR